MASIISETTHVGVHRGDVGTTLVRYSAVSYSRTYHWQSNSEREASVVMARVGHRLWAGGRCPTRGIEIKCQDTDSIGAVLSFLADDDGSPCLMPTIDSLRRRIV